MFHVDQKLFLKFGGIQRPIGTLLAWLEVGHLCETRSDHKWKAKPFNQRTPEERASFTHERRSRLRQLCLAAGGEEMFTHERERRDGEPYEPLEVV